MNHDIIVAGGGIAGMSAAIAFGSAGFTVLCVDPAPPILDRAAQGADIRSTAFLQPARQFLDRIGLWDRFEPFAMPLKNMRIIDAGGMPQVPPLRREFLSSDISDLPFGWNLPNWLIRRELLARLDEMRGVTFLSGVSATRLFTRSNEARVTFSNGETRCCRMVIAADGRNSNLRRAAGIDAKTTRFGQKALAFTVTHPIPHDQVSTEIHRSGGPFTLVPLPDLNRRPASAVVWMEEGARAAELMGLERPEFEAAMTERATDILGPLKLTSRRTLWPIIAQRATALISERLALVAEAAHVVPPIGAQGLNMSLKDIETLRDYAITDPEHLGDFAMLEAYQKARIADIRTRVAGISMLNRTSMMSREPLRNLRAAGIAALHGIPPVRHTLMRLGMDARR